MRGRTLEAPDAGLSSLWPNTDLSVPRVQGYLHPTLPCLRAYLAHEHLPHAWLVRLFPHPSPGTAPWSLLLASLLPLLFLLIFEASLREHLLQEAFPELLRLPFLTV